MNDIINELQAKIKSRIFLDFDMGNSTWFRVGGKAKGYVVVNSVKDLKIILSYSKKINYYIVGAGSNILVRDSGFDGLIIKLGKSFNKITIKKNILSVGAGVLDVNLAKFAKKQLIKDFEFFSGIPGTIGGAVKMNAGCYGSETADKLDRVLIINEFCKTEYVKVNDLRLNYRSSSLNQKSIVIKADFNFQYGSLDKIIKKNNEIKLKRESSQPLRSKTSGSTFKNPTGEFAARLIEKAGCKGKKIGGASISLLHSNFIINDGSATAHDIESLGKFIINKVIKKFNIRLEWEIKILGK